eukprot:gene6370-8772_t
MDINASYIEPMKFPLFINCLIYLGLVEIFASNTNDEAKNLIKMSVAKNPIASIDTICKQYSCCTLSEQESCSMNNMSKDVSQIVFPGGETRCIFSTSTPFGFQVIPGDKDKLVVYFQGGGACWDKLSTVPESLCSTDISVQSQVGIFDRSNVNNKFKSYTIIHPSYCSGDVWAGDVVRDYNDKNGQPVTQKGLANAQSVIDWIKKQQASGALSSTLTDLVIMGASAGSVGSQLWGKTILNSFSYKQASVIPDSYAGVFPEGSQGPLIYQYGFCKSGFLSSSLYSKCMAQTLTFQDINLEFFAATPNVPYSFIQAKVDEVQISFYIAIGASTPNATANITPTEFYNGVNDIFASYAKSLPNFVAYIIDGDHHCYTDQSIYYTSDALSTSDNGKKSINIMLSDWTNKLSLSSGQKIDSVCEGTIQLDSNSNMNVGDNKYCSSAVYPHSYTQK